MAKKTDKKKEVAIPLADGPVNSDLSESGHEQEYKDQFK